MTLFAALETATCLCQHAGRIDLAHSQDWVTADGVPLLVEGDLDGRPVAHCMGGAELVGVTRCRRVATVDDGKSHSRLVTIDGKGLVLSTSCGATDYANVNVSPWSMSQPGQSWIEIAEG